MAIVHAKLAETRSAVHRAGEVRQTQTSLVLATSCSLTSNDFRHLWWKSHGRPTALARSDENSLRMLVNSASAMRR